VRRTPWAFSEIARRKPEKEPSRFRRLVWAMAARYSSHRSRKSSGLSDRVSFSFSQVKERVNGWVI
jgi:hypothetical protein